MPKTDVNEDTTMSEEKLNPGKTLEAAMKEKDSQNAVATTKPVKTKKKKGITSIDELRAIAKKKFGPKKAADDAEDAKDGGADEASEKY